MRKNLTRPPLARFQEIARLLSTGKHYSASLIASLLETSKKTIDRDLDFMRDRLHLPIETDGVAHDENSGFYFTEPVHLCPLCLAKFKGGDR